MKKILFTILLTAGVLNASAGERFKDAASGLWFEILPDGTAQTAAAKNIKAVSKMVPQDQWNPNSPLIEGVVLEGECDENIKNNNSTSWMYDQGYICGPNYGITTDGNNVTIPAQVQAPDGNFYPVTKLGDYSFAADTKLWAGINIILPESVIEIGEGSFFCYKNLMEIDFNKVETIGDFAFFDNGIQTLKITPELVSIGSNNFAGSNKITKIVFADGVTSLNGSFFEGCTNVKTVEIPGSVKNIPENAFKGMSGLETIVLGEGVETIGASAFEGCNIKNITFPQSLRAIGDSAFANNGQLENLSLPEGVETIGASAFEGCNIKNITFPQSLRTIGDSAFANNGHLENLLLPEGLTYVGNSAFANCGIRNLSFPKSLKEIGDKAFNGNRNLTTVTFNEGLVNLGAYAFANCNISSIEIPGTVTELKEGVFANNPNLNNVIINEGVGAIDAKAFENTKNIHKLVIPGTVKEIKAETFANNSSLTELYLGEGIETIGAYAFANCNINSIEIPGTVTELKEGVFANNPNLNNVIINEGVGAIDAKAFENTKNIHKLVIPGTVKEIKAGTFANNPSLTELYLGEGIETIGESAFEWCTALSSVEIPSTVKKIEDRAFSHCESLNWLKFAENSKLKSIGNSAFDNCSALKGSEPGNESIKFPDSLEWIGDYAFNNCTSLHGIEFGPMLKHVGKKGFYRVDYLPHGLYLPGTLTEIDDEAFNFQNTVTGGLLDVYYPNRDPNDIACTAFGIYEKEGEIHTFEQDYWIYATVCLHVPVGTREIYKQLEGWKHFKCIIDDIVDYEHPMENVVGYAYMVPGETLNLYELVDYVGNKADIKWDVVNGDDEPVRVDADGNVEALKFGSKIVMALRGEQRSFDSNGNEEVRSDRNFAGAVILFVCPTVTVVYDVTDATKLPADEAAAAALYSVKTFGVNDGEVSEDDLKAIKNENVTYEHRVVYDSFPKMVVEGVEGITLEAIQRAKTDSEEHYTEDGVLQDVKEEQILDDNRLVPLNPIEENRIITLATSIDLDRKVTTDVKELELGEGIKVVVDHFDVIITGAPEDALVNVVDMHGRTVRNAPDKTFRLSTKGIYIISVAGKAFKALVK